MPAKRLHPDRPQTGAERIRRYRERQAKRVAEMEQTPDQPSHTATVDDPLRTLNIKPVEWLAAGPGRRAYLLQRALELIRRKQPDERAAMLAAATALTS